MIVVDTNVLGSLYLPNQRSEKAEAVFRKDPQWAAPLLWRSELRNVLALYLRQHLMTLEKSFTIMDRAMRLMNGHEYHVISSRVLDLTITSGCSAYDCEFVALAEDLCVWLVTLDKLVLKQFPDVAISPDKYLATQ